MNCLLLGGAQSVGKSESIYKITNYLLSRGFMDRLSLVPTAFSDFCAVLDGMDKHGNTIKVIINTATDTPAIIQNFKAFFDLNGPYDILISSIRDDDFWPRKEFFSIMGINPASPKIIEIPLAKITRRDYNFTIALDWYRNTIDCLIQHVLNQTPFDI